MSLNVSLELIVKDEFTIALLRDNLRNRRTATASPLKEKNSEKLQKPAPMSNTKAFKNVIDFHRSSVDDLRFPRTSAQRKPGQRQMNDTRRIDE